VLFIVLVHIHFIPHKQFSETNVTSHAFQQISDWEILPVLPRATENTVADQVWPTGLSLDHTDLEFLDYTLCP